MKPVSKSSLPTRRNDCFYRYLKPGALAQLRNSKISARSQKPISLSQFLTRRVDSPAPTSQISVIDRVPCLLSKFYGPRCLKRKKLMAARSVFFLNLGSSNSTPILESSDNNNTVNNDSLITVLNNDAVVAH